MDQVGPDLYELQTYCVPGIVPDTFRSLCYLFSQFKALSFRE